MIVVNRYVIDTNCLINYFHDVFNEANRLSKKAKGIIQRSLSKSGDVYLIIPSIVFVEIYRKFFRNEEFARKFYFEVYTQLIESPYIEIKPIDKEVLENFIKIADNLEDHEIHDKIVLASAMVLECSLITYDGEILKYIKKNAVIPEIIN